MTRFTLVLGASGAIGRAIAKELAQDGWSLYLQYNRNQMDVLDLMNELQQHYPKQEFMLIQADLLKGDAAQKIAASVFSIQAIVVASGQSLYKLIDDTTTEDMQALWHVHVQTPIEIITLLASKLRRHEVSYITMIGSIWGEAGGAGEVLYSTVKGAIHAFVKAYAQESAYNGVHVNAVAPGLISTKMNGHLSPEELQILTEEIPMQRAGQPEEVAHLVQFLQSGRADYMTGQIVRLNGGWYI
ncbi:elongation factor P 5-aminopentanone reductase [Kurthia sibirica]|uniref:3-ketoacyl-ACP synthase n=1 Tax=Kurthia sibirica TaxID=202750 RepID=A0A2U3AR77_9BACL|nr:SDR family oxidoreductase [Kurthia sibirica]PWI26955.1 3-ketoacyl-ACP synthase [Kurthia sibirica]GEK32500.1 3-oxoacyl-ACP reductase [Kurthia sibirica]